MINRNTGISEMEKKTPAALSDLIPADVLELLGPPPLLSTEDARLYYAMLANFAQAIQPADFITWLLVKDLADHRVEIARYRRFKSGIIQHAALKDMRIECSRWREHATYVTSRLKREAEEEKQILTKSGKTAFEIEQLNQDIDNKLNAEIAKSDAEAQSAIQRLSSTPATEADFVGLFSGWAKEHEWIDNHIHAAEQRFTASLEELDRHVRGLGQFFREEWDKIIEGELAEPSTSDQASSVQPMPLDSVSMSRGAFPTGADRVITARKSLAQSEPAPLKTAGMAGDAGARRHARRTR
jgi:hypothetical protein